MLDGDRSVRPLPIEQTQKQVILNGVGFVVELRQTKLQQLLLRILAVTQPLEVLLLLRPLSLQSSAI